MPRLSRSAIACALVLGLLAPVTGCRITEDDVRKWEHLEHGPQKLQAVLYFPKYEEPLRLQAALALIRVPPHNYVDPFDNEQNSDGIQGLVKTLARIPKPQRDTIVNALVPEVVKELKKDPPVAQDDKHAPPDPSFPFKDAAYAILSYDNQNEDRLISDDGARAQLTGALVEWAMADFENRTENRQQKYGMDQLMEMLGAEGVAGLPKLMTRESRLLDREAALVAKNGTAETKEAASAALVDIAKWILSKDWETYETPILQEQNAANPNIQFDPDPEKAKKQFQRQLEATRDEALIRVFGSMLRVGGRPAAEFAYAFAQDKTQSGKRRAGALAALEQKVDLKTYPKDLDTLIGIVKSPDSPPEVIDVAFRRLSEQPPEKVVPALYDLFAYDKWLVRRAAEATLLKMIFTPDLEGFFKKLPEKDNGKGFAMPEAIVASANMHDMKKAKGDKEVQPNETPPAFPIIKQFLGEKNTPAQRTTAASYFFSYGTKADLDLLKPYEEDKGVVPVCDTDEDCKWQCVIATEQNDKPAEGEKPWYIGNYSLDHLTGDSFEEILKGYRFGDFTRDAKKGYEGAIEFKTKRDGVDYTFTIAPWVKPPRDDKGNIPESYKPPEPIKAADLAKFAEAGATRTAGMVVIAVEAPKKEQAQAILSELVQKEKDIKTFGEYIKYCVEPAIAKNEASKAQEKK
jgi:hypothetical protein